MMGRKRTTQPSRIASVGVSSGGHAEPYLLDGVVPKQLDPTAFGVAARRRFPRVVASAAPFGGFRGAGPGIGLHHAVLQE
jgi:hypothetical protein